MRVFSITAFGIAAVVLLIAAGSSAMARLRFIRNTQIADGLVVGLNAGGSHPQIQFTSASGETISYPQGGLIFGYRIGEHVQVLYSPDNPHHTACVNRKGALWFAPGILLVLGLACIIFAVVSAGRHSVPR